MNESPGISAVAAGISKPRLSVSARMLDAETPVSPGFFLGDVLFAPNPAYPTG
jgi:hypothetical protein